MAVVPADPDPDPDPAGLPTGESRGAPADRDASVIPGIADVVGVARVTGTVAWRALLSLTAGSLDGMKELLREVRAGEPITHIIDHQLALLQAAVLDSLGIREVPSTPPLAPPAGTETVDLHAVGDAIIQRSWRADSEPRTEHPAFALMLQSLTPDEVRVLRFLAVAGPQPAIDVRTRTPFGVGSERLAGGICLIAEMAGCTRPERDRHYLANLNRLGLVRFSAEPVTDRRRYALIEAQPKAMEVTERVRKVRTIYRSIYLSLFGEQFCELCFDLEDYDAGGWADNDRGDRILGRGPRRRRRRRH